MRKRQFEIVAQDPSVRRNGRVLTAKISLPWEELEEGPMGYALYVVDYDASAAAMYNPRCSIRTPKRCRHRRRSTELREDSTYHAMNVYAIVMRTLLRFEFALGRRVGWGIRGHQLKVVPHAFEEANAFYSPDLEALLFGYVLGRQPIFLCLSHDIVAHETAHALLDGLRDKFMAPSSPDQAALHEAFADIVALLSVFSLPEVVGEPDRRESKTTTPPTGSSTSRCCRRDASEEDRAARPGRRHASRRVRSSRQRAAALGEIEPDRNILKRLEFDEEHRRGEVLVAGVMRAFLSTWVARIKSLGDRRTRMVWSTSTGSPKKAPTSPTSC